jgi:CubicO group peptidase (beta-lactamase class C family)
MRTRRIVFLAALAAFAVPSRAACQARGASREVIARAADSVAQAVLQRGHVAAMSIAVVRGRDTIVMKG